MLKVQSFEYALKQYANLRVETHKDDTYEQAAKALKKILRSTIGLLNNRLKGQGGLPEELLNELPKAAKRRNHLAHEYLVSYRARKIRGQFQAEAELGYLRGEGAYFETLFAKLRELSGELRRQEGHDPEAPYIGAEDLQGIKRAMESNENPDDPA